jgi:iron complex outermembrane receptor protein
MEGLELHIGYSMVDHLMNNARKANRRMVAAETPSTAESWSGKMATDWHMRGDDLLTVGLDAERLAREAIRTRRIVATGAVFRDPIWPEVERDLLGAFGEWNGALGPQVRMRLGARLDYAASDAGQADARLTLAPGNTSTVREQYQRFYGAEAGQVDRDEWLYSGNAMIEWQPASGRHVYVGLGRTERYPALTEMYYAFAPAPGGYLVGNPALETEKKMEIDAGFIQQSERGGVSVSLFAAQVDDYILPTRLASEDINGDGQLNTVRGYRNVKARMYGGEVSGNYTWFDSLRMPVSVSMVRGRNTEEKRDLPEIPPLQLDAALRYAREQSARPWWLQVGAQFAARQNKVDPLFPENETPSFQVFHVRGGIEVARGVNLEAGIENLFDEDYHEHLTREAVLAGGGLKPGDEIPAPGRYAHVSLSVLF